MLIDHPPDLCAYLYTGPVLFAWDMNKGKYQVGFRTKRYGDLRYNFTGIFVSACIVRRRMKG